MRGGGRDFLRRWAPLTLLLPAIWGAFDSRVSALDISTPDSAARRVIILPFRNLSEEAQAKTLIMPRIYELAERSGLRPAQAEEVEASLRRHRLRDTGQIGWESAQRLSSELECPWILLGSIDLFSADPLQVGFSARLLNGLTGDLVWVDSRYVAGEMTSSLLHPGRVKSPERLAHVVLEKLFQSLRRAWADDSSRSVVDHSPDPLAARRVLVIPFDNASGALQADQIVNNIALSSLFEQGYAVIEPGMVNEQLRSHEILPQGQIDIKTLKALAEHFDADYALTGTVIQYEFTSLPEGGLLPTVEIGARLLDVQSGQPIWSKILRRSGGDYIKIFQLGCVRSPGQLLRILFADLFDDMNEKLTHATMKSSAE